MPTFATSPSRLAALLPGASHSRQVTAQLQATVWLLFAAIATTACGGGGSGGTGPGGTGSGAFSANIAGTAWSATLGASAQGQAGGVFAIAGTSQSPNYAMSLVLYNIDAPGTYPLGVGPTVKGGIATVTSGSVGWSTALTGMAGEVTISSVSASRIAGTFSGFAEPLFGAQSGVQFTQGTFDMPVTSSGSVAVPNYAWSKVSGLISGGQFNASTVITISPPASGTLFFGGSNLDYNLTFTISGYTGPGTYTLSTGVARYLSLTTMKAPFYNLGGSGAAASGTVTITSANADRFAGSYTATLQPASQGSAPGPVSVSGTFDIGIPR